MRIPIPLLPRWFRWLAVLGVAAAIFHFSILVTTPTPPSEPGPFWDKRLHFAAYAGLAGALAYATVNLREAQRRRALLVLGVAVLYGVGIEVLQAPLPDRYFSYGDILANALGALLVLVWFAVESLVEYVPLARRS